MAGGNSHQRTVEKTRSERIEKQVLEVVSRILGGTSVAEKEPPWYETGRFWGGFTTAISIVLAVVAAMLKDVRWLLFAALPFLVLSWGVVCKPLKASRWHWRRALLSFLTVITGVGLCVIYIKLSKPETPSVSRQPNTVPGNSPSPEPEPSFSVDIEYRIIAMPSRGTSIWFGSFFYSLCSLQPTSSAIFLRVTNLQKHKEMITAYSLKSGQSTLPKIKISRGRMFQIFPKGGVGPTYVPHAVDFGAPVGEGSLVGFQVDKIDATRAIPLSGDFFDDKVGEGCYLQPDEPARGWVFIEFHKDTILPANLSISITDALQKTFTYSLPDHVGDPDGDVLHRLLTGGPLEDLSRCDVMK
jgi:hypothetical protein